ncbi:MAG: PspA/IM30 family protein [Cyanobacteria bacterium P01_G01_bin.67]
MGTFKRIKRAIQVEVNYSSNNHEKTISQNIKELEATIVRLRRSIAQASLSRKCTQEKYNYSVSEATRWQERAWLAVYVNNDYLAKEALLRKKYFEQEVAKLEIQIKSDRNTDITNNLRQKLTALEMRVGELKLLEVRQYSSKAQRILQTSMSEIDTSNVMGAFERMEEKVMQIDSESEIPKELENIDLVCFFPTLETE